MSNFREPSAEKTSIFLSQILQSQLKKQFVMSDIDQNYPKKLKVQSTTFPAPISSHAHIILIILVFIAGILNCMSLTVITVPFNYNWENRELTDPNYCNLSGLSKFSEYYMTTQLMTIVMMCSKAINLILRPHEKLAARFTLSLFILNAALMVIYSFWLTEAPTELFVDVPRNINDINDTCGFKSTTSSWFERIRVLSVLFIFGNNAMLTHIADRLMNVFGSIIHMGICLLGVLAGALISPWLASFYGVFGLLYFLGNYKNLNKII